MNISQLNPANSSYTSVASNTAAASAPEKATNSEPVKQVAASNESQTRYSSYDLENITPEQTYTMAVDLMESKTISFDSFVTLMSIGLNKQRPPGDLHNTNRSDKPFNLLKELEDVSKGEHEYFTAGTPESREQASNLLAILEGLPQQHEQANQGAISVQV